MIGKWFKKKPKEIPEIINSLMNHIEKHPAEWKMSFESIQFGGRLVARHPENDLRVSVEMWIKLYCDLDRVRIQAGDVVGYHEGKFGTYDFLNSQFELRRQGVIDIKNDKLEEKVRRLIGE